MLERRSQQRVDAADRARAAGRRLDRVGEAILEVESCARARNHGTEQGRLLSLAVMKMTGANLSASASSSASVMPSLSVSAVACQSIGNPIGAPWQSVHLVTAPAGERPHVDGIGAVSARSVSQAATGGQAASRYDTRVGGPNQVASASVRPTSVPRPTQAT
jgi:hypothetical protein